MFTLKNTSCKIRQYLQNVCQLIVTFSFRIRCRHASSCLCAYPPILSSLCLWLPVTLWDDRRGGAYQMQTSIRPWTYGSFSSIIFSKCRTNSIFYCEGTIRENWWCLSMVYYDFWSDRVTYCHYIFHIVPLLRLELSYQMILQTNAIELL